LGALGLKKAIAHVDQPLEPFGAVALLGGFALYLIGLAAFGWRATGRIAWDSVALAVASLLGILVATRPDALVAVLLVALAAVLLVLYKAVHFSAGRLRVRRRAHMLSDDASSDGAVDVGSEN
ncbi:MAG: low temperature requirement protein, partial [Thermoleophilia bacterium]|nr:low temperature requirement protein [Thermoleophilia bacterium]